MGCHFLLQGTFPIQGLKPSLLHCRQILYCLSHQGSPESHGGGGLVTKSCLTLSAPQTVAQQAPLSLEFSRHEYGVGCHFLLQGIIQKSNQGLLHCRQIPTCSMAKKKKKKKEGKKERQWLSLGEEEVWIWEGRDIVKFYILLSTGHYRWRCGRADLGKNFHLLLAPARLFKDPAYRFYVGFKVDSVAPIFTRIWQGFLINF